MRLRKPIRRGTTVVESAVVYPVFLLTIIAIVVAALGVFRYHEIASIAREATRYASVRGQQYAQATGNPVVTEKEIYDKVIWPKAVALDKDNLKYKVVIDPDHSQGSTVTVTISYTWIPEAFFGGLTLKSTSSSQIAY